MPRVRVVGPLPSTVHAGVVAGDPVRAAPPSSSVSPPSGSPVPTRSASMTPSWAELPPTRSSVAGVAVDRVVAVVALEVVGRGGAEERAHGAMVAPHRVVADLTEGGVLVGVTLDGVGAADRGIEQRHVATEDIAARRDDGVVAGDHVVVDAAGDQRVALVGDAGRVRAADEVVLAALTVDRVGGAVALGVVVVRPAEDRVGAPSPSSRSVPGPPKS